MSKMEGQSEAIRRAKVALAGVDIPARCDMLGMGASRNGEIAFRAFGADCVLRLDKLELVAAASGKEMKPGDQILVLHYLLYEVAVKESGELISFRDMPGGQFYWGPFLSRSIDLLLKRVGNNIEVLKANLNRFDWHEYPAGDLAAKVHVVGNLYGYLVYHRGDEEFGAAAEMLFDSCIKRVYNSEDVAFAASRICLGLL